MTIPVTFVGGGMNYKTYIETVPTKGDVVQIRKEPPLEVDFVHINYNFDDEDIRVHLKPLGKATNTKIRNEK